MSVTVTPLNFTFDCAVTDAEWLEVILSPLARWYWVQVDAGCRLQGTGASATLTDADAYVAGGMKVGVGDNVILPLSSANEPKSIWIAGDGGNTTARVFTSLDRITVL